MPIASTPPNGFELGKHWIAETEAGRCQGAIFRMPFP